MNNDSFFSRAEASAAVMKKSIENNHEYEKMLAGKTYNSFDKGLVLARTVSSEIASNYSNINISDYDYDVERHQEIREE